MIRAAQPGAVLWNAGLERLGVRVGKASQSFIEMIGDGRRRKIVGYSVISIADAHADVRRVLAQKALGLGKIAPPETLWHRRQFVPDRLHRNRQDEAHHRLQHVAQLGAGG